MTTSKFSLTSQRNFHLFVLHAAFVYDFAHAQSWTAHRWISLQSKNRVFAYALKSRRDIFDSFFSCCCFFPKSNVKTLMMRTPRRRLLVHVQRPSPGQIHDLDVCVGGRRPACRAKFGEMSFPRESVGLAPNSPPPLDPLHLWPH